MSQIDEWLNLMSKADEMMNTKGDVDSTIPFLVELLDIYQNAHLEDAAARVTQYLLSFGSAIIPYLNLQQQETNFIHYFCGYVMPQCSDDLLMMMREQLWGVIQRNDTSEETDLVVIDYLLQRKVFINELKEILVEKKKHMEQELIQGDSPFIQNYLGSLNNILRSYQ
ncbi:hypothetical protein [Paenibacillus motobuensis]|uniref:Immunity protein 30 domain-containing protein n=1 Tax=Paenibacillus motobuensis TaxID=295324 RepID=A0ABP3I1E4_9BACL